MAVTAPERPRRAPEFDDPERLEALIKEARRRARLRRLRYATCVVLVASAGVAAVLGPGRGGGAGGTAAPEPAPAAWDIKLGGPRLAYVPVGGRGLFVTEPDGSGSRVLARCPAEASCRIINPVWSPDGRRIAFTRLYAPRGVVLGDALYLVGLDGRGERRLAECRVDDGCRGLLPSVASWSRDGSQIAFVRGETISILDVESGRGRRLTSCPQRRCMDSWPVWSPDQKTIAFTRGPALYRVDISGSHLIRLAHEGNNPAWTRDGRRILVGTREGIVSVAADGSEATLIAPAHAGEGPPAAPTLSPDGSRVLYFSTPYDSRGFRAEIWTMKPNGREKKRLYTSQCCVVGRGIAAWSGDGTRLAFSNYGSHQAGNRGGTFVVDSDGTRLRRLTQLPAGLAWQPSGQRTEGSDR
jgi:Tol biopolymer transport system component